MKTRNIESLPFGQRQHPGGRGSIWTIECGQCGVIESLGQQDFGGLIACEQLPKKAQNKAWLVGKKAKDHVCPACIARAEEAKRAKEAKEKREMETKKTVVPLRADPPKEMDKEDGRIIFAKLNDVYVGKEVGYSPGWTDKKVAEDLNVPRIWVAKVREEWFGPATNEEIETVLKEIRAAAEAVRGLNADLLALNRKATEYGASLAAMERRIERLEKQAGRIETAVI